MVAGFPLPSLTHAQFLERHPTKTRRLRPVSFFRLQAVLIFLLTCFLSALGSLQLGPVNGSVLRLSLNGRFRDARWLALGGSLPEFLYAGIAVWGSHWLGQITQARRYLDWAIVLIFLVMGIRLIRTKPKSIPTEDTKPRSVLPFWQGLGLGLLNPQLPLFWLSILIWYKMSLGLEVDSSISSTAFVLGTGMGAFCLLLGWVEICRRYQNRVLAFSQKHPPEIWIGAFFVVLALIQIIKHL
jgi:threonine/homoserine/homoserine lactone efflux protein